MKKMFFCLFILMQTIFGFSENCLLSPEMESYDVHSSTIIETTPNDLLVVWKGSVTDGYCNRDTVYVDHIWARKCVQGKWEEAKQIYTISHTCIWNPVIFPLSPKELLLFFRLGPHPRDLIGMMMRSMDGGEHWSEPEPLPAGIGGPTNCKPVISPEGKIIVGSSIESGSPLWKEKATACWIEISEDGGKQWKKVGPITIPSQPFGVIAPALAYDAKGRLHLFCRDRSIFLGKEGKIWAAVSQDHGETWSELKETSLPNPDSGIDAVTLQDGSICIAYNNSTHLREKLSLALFDGVKNYTPFIELEAFQGEFPSLIQTQDGKLHITYAYHPDNKYQRRIKYVSIELKD